MKRDFWLQKWEEGDIPFHQQDVNTDLIQYFSQLDLRKGEHILVPLCGKSVDLIWFAKQGLSVIGVELSPIACHDFFSEWGVEPIVTNHGSFTIYEYNHIKIFCGDFFELSTDSLPSIKGVYDCKALIALPPDVRQRYVKHLIACVGEHVKILLITLDTHDTVKSPPFPINQAEINMLYGGCFNIQRLKQETTRALSDNLIQKGFTEIMETIYLIKK